MYYEVLKGNQFLTDYCTIQNALNHDLVDIVSVENYFNIMNQDITK